MFACADDLGVKRTEMIGILVSLWLWALDNAQDGSLAGVSNKTIARVCDFPEKKAGKLVESLVKNKFLDQEGDNYIIHDWYDYAGKLMERREKDRSRKQKGKKDSVEFRENSTGNPTEQPENSHATVPYHTVPYPTNTFTGAGGESARAAGEKELELIGLKPGEYPGVTRERVDQVVGDTVNLFRKYRGGAAETSLDRRMVFLLSDYRGNCELLDYAFKQARIAGKVNDWRYIAGVVKTLRARNITTTEQAEEWDENRPDLDGEESQVSMANLLRNHGVDV